MKIGLMLYLVNDRETNSKRPYQSIRELAQQAEADGFDSIWLADHLMYRRAGRSHAPAGDRPAGGVQLFP
jgi:alkanesulfonate monooxygenase SsuD/methylene tetrahydromethanopterin reductase-like flavin-dependent oxidoreductase (luciferase family)